ncbi:MAG: TylF/MycF/NovP-related O-methyltransferase [Phycisphaerae bacterium]|nr:TylF/MycF/NovP-related O-methyltransferase [Phycisphaerae bacterium]
MRSPSRHIDMTTTLPRTDERLIRAEALHHAGDHRGALGLLAAAKAERVGTPEVDDLRARCFESLGDASSAEQARREARRWSHAGAGQLPDTEPKSSREHQPVTMDIADDDEWFNAARAAVAPFTMLSESRLRSLHDLARSVLVGQLGGDFVECGVAAGGSSALLAGCIRRYGRNQHVWCLDTFTGMPTPSELDTDRRGVPAADSGWGTGTCSAPERCVREAAGFFGAEDRLIIRPGLFQDTLPFLGRRLGRIALLHLDGDWYESTKVCFEHLWHLVATDGAIQIDDYGHWEGCRRATDEFLASRGVTAVLTRVDYTGVSLRKPASKSLVGGT